MSKVYIYGSANPMNKRGCCCWLVPATISHKKTDWFFYKEETTANEMLMTALVEAVKTQLMTGATEITVVTTSAYFFDLYENKNYKSWKNKSDFPNEVQWKEFISLEEDMNSKGILFTVEKTTVKNATIKMIKKALKE